MRRAWPLLLLLACNSSSPPEHAENEPISAQSVEDLCFAETRSGAVDRFPFADKLGTLNGWLEERLDEPAHAFYFETLMQTPVHQQGDRLRSEAERVGLARCPTAGLLDFLADLPRMGLTTDDCIAACLKRNEGLDGVDRSACERGCGTGG